MKKIIIAVLAMLCGNFAAKAQSGQVCIDNNTNYDISVSFQARCTIPSVYAACTLNTDKFMVLAHTSATCFSTANALILAWGSTWTGPVPFTATTGNPYAWGSAGTNFNWTAMTYTLMPTGAFIPTCSTPQYVNRLPDPCHVYQPTRTCGGVTATFTYTGTGGLNNVLCNFY